MTGGFFKCRTCREFLGGHNFTISNGYRRRDCKECYNKNERAKYEARKTRNIAEAYGAGMVTTREVGGDPPKTWIVALQQENEALKKQVRELEDECEELNDEIIKLTEKENEQA